MSTDQRWLAQLLYPDHFNEAGERIDPVTPVPAGTDTPLEPVSDPAADHNALISYLLRARNPEHSDPEQPIETNTPAFDGGALDREFHNETADFNNALNAMLKGKTSQGQDV